MPKILINEKDRTSPGAASGYANYSVLIAGFAGIDDPKKALDENELKKLPQADSNGIYEFSSAADFVKVIGRRAALVKDSINQKIACRHYGNQMAYELLNMGYTVLWKTISSVSELIDADFWDVFKDKANYDFRFITHGLLESNAANNEVASAISRKAALDNALKGLQDLAVAAGVDLAKDILPDDASADDTLETIINLYDAYAGRYEGEDVTLLAFDSNDFAGLIADGATTVYLTFKDAYTGVQNELNNFVNLDNYMIDEAVIDDANNCIATLATYIAKGANADGSSANDMNSIELAGRGDCTALIELDENCYINYEASPEAAIIEGINKMSIAADGNKGKYCALTVPSVEYKMTDDSVYNNKKFPAAFHYLACFMASLNHGFREWYAAAGFTRGVSGLTINKTTVKLGEIAINALEPRQSYTDGPKFACNVIANFRGSYYLWGNRTAHNLDEQDLVAHHFLNIRQLCTTIKKQLYVACRRFTFDPNSDVLWINFCNAIRPTLDAMKADQGIRDYKIIKVLDNPKKATLRAKIRIIPIEAVEDFDLEVSLEDSFGEVAVEV